MTLHFSIFAQTSTREMSSDESPSAPPPLELLPGNKPSDVGRGKHSAHQLVANQTALYKEYIIAVEEIKMMQVRHSLTNTKSCSKRAEPCARASLDDESSSRALARPLSADPRRRCSHARSTPSQSALKQCVQKHGVNAAEECSEMRDRLWEKINTPNYGAPGPPQGSSRYMAKPRRPAEA